MLSPFWISRYAVTNAQCAAFVAATGRPTEAELFGWSFVFAGLLPVNFPPTRAVAGPPWWRQVEGTNWAHPEGPQSGIDERANHPVVHVSWNDACAFCAWTGSRLTEAEWKFAARGALAQSRLPWGDELEPGGEHRINVIHGTFPAENNVAHGYAGPTPVGALEPSGRVRPLKGGPVIRFGRRVGRMRPSCCPHEDLPRSSPEESRATLGRARVPTSHPPSRVSALAWLAGLPDRRVAQTPPACDLRSVSTRTGVEVGSGTGTLP